MTRREISDDLSIFAPEELGQKPVERSIQLAKKKDWSINYMVVEAILQYLKREEGR